MTASDELPDPMAGHDGLKAQLQELEAFLARSSAEGDPPPAVALEMVERLREVVRALDGLTSSLGDE